MRRTTVVAVVLVCASGALCADAVTKWTRSPGDPGDWFAAENWSNGVPTTTVFRRIEAYVENGGTCRISQAGANTGFLYLTNGEIEQTGGSLLVREMENGSGSCTIGQAGRYRMVDGDVEFSRLVVDGDFVQTGGHVDIDYYFGVPDLQIGGAYELRSGSLISNWTTIRKDGILLQTGGTADLGTMDIQGTFRLESGTTTAITDAHVSGNVYWNSDQPYGHGPLNVDVMDGGEFYHAGGETGGVNFTIRPGGSYTLAAGSLNYGWGEISGKLTICDGTGMIRFSELAIGPGADLDVPPGTPIATHVFRAWVGRGSISGVENLTLRLEGGPSEIEAWSCPSSIKEEQMVLGGITLGDNGPVDAVITNYWDASWLIAESEEVVLTKSLAIQEGSVLDLNGLAIWVRGDVTDLLDGYVADGRIIDSTHSFPSLHSVYWPNVNWTIVPEPATLAMLALLALSLPKRGWLALLRRKSGYGG